jgi:hypothetical protein
MRYDSCRQCTKRRIKCDKGAPRCAKCIKKGLECSGIGKTYRFVQNTTPETIETSSPVQKRQSEPRRDEDVAPNDVTYTALFPRLRSTGDGNIGFIVDEGEDVEAVVASQTYTQQTIDGAMVHLPRQQTVSGTIAAQTAQYPLDWSVAFYKPGQLMLLDHCKLTLP